MKAKYILLILAALLLLPLSFSSCGVDRWKAYAEQTATARWIADTMRVWYYWADQMPSEDELNYFDRPDAFFKSMLSEEDRFSVIDSLHTSAATTRSIPDTDYSYGFQFAVGRVGGNLAAHLLYVVPGSPADEAGLRRGDFIFAINDQPLTEESARSLYGGAALSLVIGHYVADGDSMAYAPEPVQLSAARMVDDNPVHYYNVYSDGLHRVGYLVYNHFSYGATTATREYDEALRQAFAYFAAQQVDEFVLDLRYNNGGYLTSAQLLTTLLAPASCLGQPMAVVAYNDRRNPPADAYSFNESLIGAGANLNLKRLYVLTSNQTASASEFVINCLKPYMEVILIGATTVGKNVGSITFDNPQLLMTMSPIVCQIFNAEGSSDYTEGFPADHPLDENSNMATFLPFGHPQEAMLAKALSLIAGGEGDTSGGEGNASGDGTEVLEAASTHRLQLLPKYNSLERRGSGVVRIR